MHLSIFCGVDRPECGTFWTSNTHDFFTTFDGRSKLEQWNTRSNTCQLIIVQADALCSNLQMLPFATFQFVNIIISYFFMFMFLKRSDMRYLDCYTSGKFLFAMYRASGRSRK